MRKSSGAPGERAIGQGKAFGSQGEMGRSNMPAVAGPEAHPSASPEAGREFGALETYATYLRLLARMNLGKGLGGILDALDIAHQALLVAQRERDQLESMPRGSGWCG